ncbi:MAG: hypothetical protein ACXU89_24590, partial [Xanthobacteraceae bacterium]
MSAFPRNGSFLTMLQPGPGFSKVQKSGRNGPSGDRVLPLSGACWNQLDPPKLDQSISNGALRTSGVRGLE